MESLKQDWRTARLTERQRAILEYCEKLGRQPHTLTPDDLWHLRAHDLDDEAILGVVLVVGFFHLATRVADALGVQLDPELTPGTPAYSRFIERQG